MPSRSVLATIVALVFVTWILVSSVNTVQIPSQGNTGSNGSTKNTGPTGNPNGTGQSGPGTNATGTKNTLIGSLTFPTLTLPNLHLNLSFLNILYKIALMILHFLQPVFHVLFLFMEFVGYLVGYLIELIIMLLPSWFHLGKANMNNSPILHHPISRTVTGGPSGTAGSTMLAMPAFITYIIIGLAVILIAVTGLSSISNRKKKKSDSMQNFPDDNILLVNPSTRKTGYSYIPHNVVSVPFLGWSRGNDLINPEIPADLPLIYPAGKPLSVHMRTAGLLKGEYTLVNQNGDQDYSIALPEGCTETSAKSGLESEKKVFRGVNIRNEISLLMRLNLASLLPESALDAEHKTVRELLYSEEMKGLLAGDRKLSEMIRSYEKAYYGLKETDWSQFQQYLYCIRDTFADARIAKCGS